MSGSDERRAGAGQRVERGRARRYPRVRAKVIICVTARA